MSLGLPRLLFSLVLVVSLAAPTAAAQAADRLVEAGFSGVRSIPGPVGDALDGSDDASSRTSSSSATDEEIDRHEAPSSADADASPTVPTWLWTLPVGLAVAGVAAAGWSLRDRTSPKRDADQDPDPEGDGANAREGSARDRSPAGTDASASPQAGEAAEPFLAEPPPEGVDGLLEVAHAHARRDDFEAAARWFEMTIALRPRLATAHFCLGLSLEQLGRDEEALEAFEAVEEIGYHGPAPVYRQARVLARMGRTEEALQRLGVALSAEPELTSNAVDDPVFERFDDHPRFLALVGRL